MSHTNRLSRIDLIDRADALAFLVRARWGVPVRKWWALTALAPGLAGAAARRSFRRCCSAVECDAHPSAGPTPGPRQEAEEKRAAAAQRRAAQEAQAAAAARKGKAPLVAPPEEELQGEEEAMEED